MRGAIAQEQLVDQVLNPLFDSSRFCPVCRLVPDALLSLRRRKGRLPSRLYCYNLYPAPPNRAFPTQSLYTP